jgi:hypothetical protein
MIVDRDSTPPRISGSYVRSESEQVVYLRELLSIFEEEGVDSAFWFTFAGYGLPHRPDPVLDLDLAVRGDQTAGGRRGVGAEGGLSRARRGVRLIV